MKREDITTIQVKRTTKAELDKLGQKGETYDDVIRRLVKVATADRPHGEE